MKNSLKRQDGFSGIDIVVSIGIIIIFVSIIAIVYVNLSTVNMEIERRTKRGEYGAAGDACDFPDFARAAYSHPTGKLGPTGLRQCLLRVLPGCTKRLENSRTQPQGDPFSFPGVRPNNPLRSPAPPDNQTQSDQ